jgi:hypothetical protein
MSDMAVDNRIRRTVIDELGRTTDNLEWLREQMHHTLRDFFLTGLLATNLPGLSWPAIEGECL